MAAALLMAATATARETYNFNAGWLMGDSRTKVTLPRAWNEDEAFRVSVYQMSDSVVWYRKDFSLPADAAGKRVFIEFEGARQAAEVWLNGHRVGLSENGVMAFGFDLTPYIRKGKNRIEVRTDNSWDYREQATGSTFQWNAKSFNANYGGLTRNVRLHIVGDVYQTLPLYSSLGTTGTYVYATQYDIPGREATVSAATEVRNDGSTPATVDYTVIVEEMDGSELARFSGGRHTLGPHSTRTLVAALLVVGLRLPVSREDRRGHRHRGHHHGLPQDRVCPRHDNAQRQGDAGSRLCAALNQRVARRGVGRPGVAQRLLQLAAR